MKHYFQQQNTFTSIALLKRLTDTQILIKLLCFMEYEGVLSCSKETIIGSHTMTHTANPHLHTPTTCKSEVSRLAM